MCVIVIKPPNTGVSREDIEAMYKQNPHGVGISYYDPKEDMLVWRKGLTDWDEIEEIIKELYPIEAIIHFRYGTSGPNNAEMCHPFPIGEENRLSGESKQLFYHNGELKSFEPENNSPYSDAYIFWKDVINHIDIPLTKEIVKWFDDGINKMAIHTTEGIQTVGEYYDWNGLKVSNLKFTRFLFEKSKPRKVLSFIKWKIVLKSIDGIINGFTKLKNKIE